MKNLKFCDGHTNGFRHLETDLGGLEEEFDVGIKIEEEESHLYEQDPATGLKAWYEPRLVLYASVVHKNFPNDRHTLRYGLTRTAYGTELKSIDEAKPLLVKLALPLLERDLKKMEAGGEPESATKVLMLSW